MKNKGGFGWFLETSLLDIPKLYLAKIRHNPKKWLTSNGINAMFVGLVFAIFFIGTGLWNLVNFATKDYFGNYQYLTQANGFEKNKNDFISSKYDIYKSWELICSTDFLGIKIEHSAVTNEFAPQSICYNDDEVYTSNTDSNIPKNVNFQGYLQDKNNSVISVLAPIEVLGDPNLGFKNKSLVLGQTIKLPNITTNITGNSSESLQIVGFFKPTGYDNALVMSSQNAQKLFAKQQWNTTKNYIFAHKTKVSQERFVAIEGQQSQYIRSSYMIYDLLYDNVVVFKILLGLLSFIATIFVVFGIRNNLQSNQKFYELLKILNCGYVWVFRLFDIAISFLFAVFIGILFGWLAQHLVFFVSRDFLWDNLSVVMGNVDFIKI